MAKRKQPTLTRPPRGEGRVLAGVCAALADRFGLSRTLVRLVFVIAGLVGAGELAYIIAWIIIPRADKERDPRGPTGCRRGS